MSLVIEIFEPGRKSPSIKRFSQPTITVGRAWDSDLIIVDDEVDAHHLQIQHDTEAQQLQLTDLGSTNGTHLQTGLGSRRLKKTITVKYGQKITLGQTSICIHHINSPVAPVKVHSRTEKLILFLSHPVVAISLCLLALLSTLYNTFLSSSTLLEWDAYTSSLLWLTFALLLWSLVWGSLAKLTKHRFMVWAHLSIAALLLVMDHLLRWMIDVIAFNTLSITISQILSAIANILVLGTWVWVTLQIMTHLRFRTKFVATGILLIFFGVSAYVLPYFEEPEWQSQTQLETTSLPPSWLFVQPVSPSQFSQNIVDNLQNSQSAIDSASPNP